MAGHHIAFAGTAVILGIVALVIVLGVRDKASDEVVEG